MNRGQRQGREESSEERPISYESFKYTNIFKNAQGWNSFIKEKLPNMSKIKHNQNKSMMHRLTMYNINGSN